MARLIDADALKKAIPETTVDASTKYKYCVTFEREDVLAIIDAAPTVDIDRPTRSQFKRMAVQLGYEPVRHGRWICIREEYDKYECSVCAFVDSNCSGYYGFHDVTEQEYCPNCGARMDGAE